MNTKKTKPNTEKWPESIGFNISNVGPLILWISDTVFFLTNSWVGNGLLLCWCLGWVNRPSKGNGEAGRFDTNSSSEIAQKFCPLHCMLISKISYTSSLKKLQSFRTSDLTPMGRSSRLLFTEQFPLLTLFIHCFHCNKSWGLPRAVRSHSYILSLGDQ